jgi:hypothetical protein
MINIEVNKYLLIDPGKPDNGINIRGFGLGFCPAV